LVNWRNVTLNGRPLGFAAPMALDSLIIPRSGILHLDYISQAEAPEGEAATDVVFGRLINEVCYAPESALFAAFASPKETDPESSF
jgi:hypothetical protein